MKTFAILFIALMSSTPTWAFMMCSDVHTSTPKRFSVASLAKVASSTQLKGHQLQFGFESEYTPDQFDRLVEYYGPSDIANEKWFEMSLNDRVTEIKNRANRLVVVSDDIGIELKKSTPKTSAFPAKLALDSTGNLEFILPPMDSLETYQRVREQINTTFGEGSMQTTLSIDRNDLFDYFRANQKSNESARLDSLIGFSKFYFLYDALAKLDSGFQRAQKNPNQETARSFDHPFLGPMTLSKSELWLHVLHENYQGRMMNSSELAFLRKSDDSFKYIGGTTYRPDIALPSRLVWEVRDAHKSTLALQERVDRMTKFLEKLPTTFDGFSSLSVFNPKALYEKMSVSVQHMLKKSFPAKMKGGIDYTPSEIEALQVYRNFSWPMQDWAPLLKSINRPETLAQVATAQAHYLASLESIAGQHLEKAQARVQVQLALVQFSRQSGLYEILTDWQSRNFR